MCAQSLAGSFTRTIGDEDVAGCSMNDSRFARLSAGRFRASKRVSIAMSSYNAAKRPRMMGTCWGTCRGRWRILVA